MFDEFTYEKQIITAFLLTDINMGLSKIKKVGHFLICSCQRHFYVIGINMKISKIKKASHSLICFDVARMSLSIEFFMFDGIFVIDRDNYRV